MDFEVVSLDGSERYVNDDAVVLTEDGTRIFGGLIDRPAEAGFGGTGASVAITQRLGAADFNVYASRIRLTADISAGTFKAFLTVIAGALSAQGVTLDPAQVNGPNLPALSYHDRLITEVLDEGTALASGAGATSWIWEIDYDDVLRGFEAGTQAAPFNITDGDGNVLGDITVEQPRSSDYGNYAVVLGGTGQREVTDAFTSDGTADYTLTYTLASHRGYVTCNGNNETLDVAGQGAIWTLDAAAGTITRSSPPTVGWAIAITYTAQFPVRVYADGGAPAANRVMRVYEEPEVFDRAVLQALANSYVVRDMASPKTVRYMAVYDKTDLHPGQTQTITSIKRNLSGSHLLTDVRIVHVRGQLVRREVTAVSTTRLPATLRQTFRQVLGTGSGGAAAGSVTMVSGGGSTTVLSSSVYLGGTDRVALPAAAVTDWVDVYDIVPYDDAESSFTGRVRVLLWAREADVGVTARLYNATDATAVESDEVIAQTPTLATILSPILVGKTYRLQVKGTTGSGAVWANGGTLKAA